MPFNALIVGSDSFPAAPPQRRRLGIPPSGTHETLRTLRLENVPGEAARGLTALLERAGGRARVATPRGPGGAVVLLQGDTESLTALIRAAGRRPRLRGASVEIREVLINAATRPRTLALSRGHLPIGARTLIMGILNVTPDSFSDGGRHLEPARAVERALEMAEAGADLIDIGGESTRPGARPVPVEVELRRVMPVLEGVAAALSTGAMRRPLLSIDTRKAEVARRAAAAGADLINDVSGLTYDPAMASAVAESGLPVVIQHARGTPATMQRSPRYVHLLPEIAAFLRSRIEKAARAGVRRDKIIIDPGLGFGKRRLDNLAILRHLRVLTSLGRPILVGASRKSFLKGGDPAPPDARLEASLAAEALAIAGGADIIRVHDVREAVRVASLCDAVTRDATAGS